MQLTWLQVQELYLIPSAIQSKQESDAMKGVGGVTKEAFVSAYLEAMPEASVERAEAAWLKDQRGF
jgi:hypothetical protein